ncbi:MAG TPA: PadR family transcriptional regulator, partial [Candidatus Sulfotelmatobacter sp.]|nr:PadR family transcriptional regulator [Candidatus Sulfotelmatobacter sp.]
RRPMSLKFAVLGLIALKPASGYDIKRTIDRSIHFIWNVTGPQIYNTLRALRDEGLIESETVAQTGRPDKQVHRITPAGTRALQAFCNAPVRASVTRDEVLLRIFFGNFAEEAVVMRELEAYLERIRGERAAMEATEARILAHPGPRHQARRFQLLSLRLKVAQYRVTERELERFCRGEAEARASRSAARNAGQEAPLALVYPAEQPARAGRVRLR